MSTKTQAHTALVLGSRHPAKWQVLELMGRLGIQAVSVQQQPEEGADGFLLIVVATDADELSSYYMLAHTQAAVVVCDASPKKNLATEETPFAHSIHLDAPLEQWKKTLEQALHTQTKPAQRTPRLIGHSLAMQGVLNLVQRASQSDATVLITGPSGVGKEVVAHAIHEQSKRAKAPFVVVNCAAIPSELIESELFGHTKGAFSGALAKRQGHFEAASGGTLFLDEIGDMPSHLQSKLLRVLQDKQITPLGGNRSKRIDVRILAATNQDLEQAVRNGAFRSDLYHRLHVLPIQVPPLSMRLEDLPLLVAHRNEELHDCYQRKVRLNAEALKAFERYSWPGNVRELHNVMERLLIEYPNQTIDILDLPSNMHASGVPLVEPLVALPDNFSLKDKIAHLERAYVLKALQQSGWVVSKAAHLLHLKRTTLIEKMKKYRIHQEHDK